LPKTPAGLAGEIRKCIPSLKKIGILIDIPRKKERRNGESPRTIFYIKHFSQNSLTTFNREMSSTSGTPSLHSNLKEEKTVSYHCADDVAPVVAPDYEKHRCATLCATPVLLRSEGETEIKDLKKKDVEISSHACATRATQNPLVTDSRCLKCENRDPVHSNFCQWNKGGLIISWEKCQGQNFRQNSESVQN